MKYGDLLHFSHPHHKLRYDISDRPFRCDGCREIGIGSRFNCPPCDFDLHTHCTTTTTSSSSSSLRHPFYPNCLFRFLPSPPPRDAPRYCNACGRTIAGFSFRCHSCGFDLHPCCAALPHVLQPDTGLRLRLHSRAPAPCHRCGRKGRSWCYVSECRDCVLHVACVMEMLVENWHEMYYGEGKKVVMNGIEGHRGGKGKGKVKRCCEVAALAVQFVVSAVLGDPTAAIAGVVSSFLFR